MDNNSVQTARQLLLNGINGQQGPLFAAPAAAKVYLPAPPPQAPPLKPLPGRSTSDMVLSLLGQSVVKRTKDGAVMRWALMSLFLTAIASLVCVLQIHNQQTVPTCWSSSASNFMVIACILVTIIVGVMVGISIAYFRAQPLESRDDKRSYVYPPFLFFGFLTIAALVSWAMLVNVTVKGRANIGQSGTSNCVTSDDYNAGIAGAVMALVVSMVGTVAAYYWSK